MTQHSQSEFQGPQITPATPEMTGQAGSRAHARAAGWAPEEEAPAHWAPPEAPLAMPRQQLERDRPARRHLGLFAAFRQTAA
ncbi:MAG: hypothetical protein GYB53_07805 [Rhodobacteraceae bacterium]|nr:hypothetical protein [Paracoccaceae bacterium]MBR9819989.1 hypothetical protein [Paracoccaceae bacterium]